MSGFAYAKSMAIPRPMMKEASIRPRSRNTLACSAGIISGCRAAPSRKREHMMPMPTQAPSAPRPIMSPTPMPVYAWIWATSCNLSIDFSFLGRLDFTNRISVVLVRHRDIGDGKHHEDIRLEERDEAVEKQPCGLRERAPDRPENAARREQRDEKEHDLARVHVAEQPQRVRQ